MYELIKREYTKKGKPLKIVADWDDCLQFTKPMMIYNGANISGSFEEFFKKYAEMTVCSPRPSSSQMTVEGDNSELAQKINEFEKKRRELRGKGKQNPYKTPDFYDKSPFTSCAADLLKALKEGLIKKLVIITQYTGEKDDFVRNKEKVIKKTFLKFPQAELAINRVDRIDNPKKGMNEYKLFKPYRHEIIAEKYPEFDILFDDNPEILKECQAVFPPDKVYAAPNYKSLRKVPNCILVPNQVSELKPSDFSIDNERKVNKEENKPFIRKDNPWFWSAWIASLLLVTIGTFFIIKRYVGKKSKKKV